MAGTAPDTRYGLIALLVARRVTAERKRRQALAEAKAARDADRIEALKEKDLKARRAGWFRR